MKNMKLIRPAVSLVICLIAIIVCLVSAGNFNALADETTITASKSISAGSYSYGITDYAYYGGDAYTGIQQAGADAANNVRRLGDNMSDAANMLYSAQRNAANNALAATNGIAALGSLLCTALAFAFALPGAKHLLDLLQVILEMKSVPQQTVPAMPVEPQAPQTAEVTE